MAGVEGKPTFKDVFTAELGEVTARRKACGLEAPAEGGPSTKQELFGVALSGGGIRSASFCLGMLQELAQAGLLRRVDYLSTVSGGGYIGACVSSLLGRKEEGEEELAGKDFPLRKPEGQREPAALTHLRNSSNYLSSGGMVGMMRMVSLAVRGIVLNLLLLAPFLLLATLATYVLYQFPEVDPVKYGAVAVAMSGVVFGSLMISYPLFSRLFRSWITWEMRDTLERLLAYGLMLLLSAATAVVTLWVVDQVLLYPWSKTIAEDWFSLEYWPAWLFVGIFGMTMLLAGPASFFATRAVKRVFLLLAGLLGPLTLFVTYLGLCVAVVRVPYLSLALTEELFLRVDQSETNLVALNESGETLLAQELRRKGILRDDGTKTWPENVKVLTPLEGVMDGGYSMLVVGPCVAGRGFESCPEIARIGKSRDRLFVKPAVEVSRSRRPIFLLVLAVALMVFNHLILDINTISPHGFYRDRLSRAFVVRMRKTEGGEAVESVDTLKLTDLNQKGSVAPYHLINAALNLEGSRQPDLRGRNATFFFFSKLFSGSELTGYQATAEVERADGRLTLASAMAISAAAAAPNMGSTTVKPLVFVLTLLNVRLGYWAPNPGKLPFRFRRSTGVLYLLREALGLVDERATFVNLSDGGHLENLGVFELLRRRCKWILSVDAEEDHGLGFGGLVTLIRYARIDLGIGIEIDLRGIQERKEHYAVGTIHYGDGEEPGTLIYCKATTCGREQLYVRDYGTRYPDFPHESTADQFFGETQFEAYRALGAHTGAECMEELQGLVSGGGL